jgi:uncharacterized membrane protein
MLPSPATRTVPDWPSPSRRLSYIDWMRGLAILIMIEAHVMDAWTAPADRGSLAFGCAAILAGFAAPMFLFLAGVSAVLGAGARARRTGNEAAAAASVRRRGWEVFGLAYLFRLQAYLLNPKAMLTGLLKVDILNIMGPSIVASAALWQAVRSYAGRIAVFASATMTVTLLTPLVRTSTLVQALPAPLQWYIKPVPGRNNFMFFPWMGFVFAGALVGVLIERPRTAAAERRFHALAVPMALAFAAACYAGSYLPSIYADSQFWTSAPSFFLLRVGIVTGVLSIVYFWEQRPRLLSRTWSPMAQFGRASLFVYWVHVELAYGVFSQPLHRNLPFGTAVLAFALFSLFMFALAMLKNHLVARWKEWQRSRREVPEIAMS